MSVARLSRDRKRQLGQYLTPRRMAAAIVRQLSIAPDHRVLEPSFGHGAFIFEMVDVLATIMPEDRLRAWCRTNLYGCEIDQEAYAAFAGEWESRGLGGIPEGLENADFFTWMPPGCDRIASTDPRLYFGSNLPQFDLVIGNPPFGGSIAPSIQDELDSIFGVRNRMKIKKETYAFFIVKSIDLLKPGGRLVFICSDTLLTISTMTGLRSLMQSTCEVQVSSVPGAFDDTSQAMVLLTLTKRIDKASIVTVFEKPIPIAEVESTPNLSWRVNGGFAKYFTGATVGDKMVATSGMTIGNNELFLRRIVDGAIVEPYDFSYSDERVTVKREVSRARLGKVSELRLCRIREMEREGATDKGVTAELRAIPLTVRLPHEDYRYYNKATSRIVYSEPEWVVFWRDDGNYVYTFKKAGNWYLHGVGGRRYFLREGLTWALIAPRLYARYLPAGYILDSGAPCAFPRDGVSCDEMLFILGWALTDDCNLILKSVLNHTRNIQSKDFERLPYPVWVDEGSRAVAIEVVKGLVDRARAGECLTFSSEQVRGLNRLYAWRDRCCVSLVGQGPRTKQMGLF
jgi:hypothetical protein